MRRTTARLIGLLMLASAAPALAAAPLADACNDLAAICGTANGSCSAGELARAPGRLPPTAQAEIDKMRISRQPMPALLREINAETAAAYQSADPVARAKARTLRRQIENALMRETAARAVLRNLYSDAPIKERMTWFWLNHFNVYIQKRDIVEMVADYEDKLRAAAFGRFSDLLRTTVTHPAMLRYLDNDLNFAGRINENYARELMELHTLGVGGGYSQADVIQLAHILTGLTVRVDEQEAVIPRALAGYHVRDGLFEFDPRKHDFGAKTLLGQTISGGGMNEVDRALDLLARSPATMDHVSRRIALFFLGKPPPQATVDRMTAAWRKSDGSIAAVLEAMFNAPGYCDAQARGIKDPVDYVLSAVRAVVPKQAVINPTPVVTWIERLGERLYGRQTPDGYPLDGQSWIYPGQMATRFEIARLISHDKGNLLLSNGVDMEGDTSVSPAITLSARTLDLVNAAQTPEKRNMLILSSPEFMRR
jgi:uncharacterized protein (DUF1800 family)